MALSNSPPSAGADPYVTGPADRTAVARNFAYGALSVLGVLSLFLLARPYGGIIHDARLYIGYGLAALHPDSLGHDIVLAEHGQSGFTISPALLIVLVEMFGSAAAAKLVSLAGLVLWFAAAAALMAGLARGRTRWVMLIFAALVPARYGGFGIFSYAEALAGPRPYAEAFVLLALAFLAADRKFAALVPLVVAGLLHPIMALPGFAVWFWLMAFDPRMRVVRPIVGIVIGVLGLALLALAAALGVSVADRLFTAFDPTWREILMTRTPYLFVTAWWFADWSQLTVHVITVAIAASLVEGRARSLFTAAAVIGVGGVLVSLLFGDVLGSLLVVQVQAWRATWILAVLAAAGLGLCAVVMWQRGSVARIALALLVLSWIDFQLPFAALGTSLLALALTFLPLRLTSDFHLVTRLAWWAVALCALLFFGMHLYVLMLLLPDMPEGAWGGLAMIRDLNVLAVPVCVLAVLWANAENAKATMAVTGLASVALVAAALLLWDDRPSWERATDSFGPDPKLEQLIASRPGEVLWIGGGFATWSEAARPNWVSRLQGASSVFSRELALTWHNRAQLLSSLGLVDDRVRKPFQARERTSNEEPHLTHLSDTRLERLCGLPDAPAWLVVPERSMKDAAVSLSRWRPQHWTAPSPKYAFAWDGERINWITTQDFAVIRCAS